MSSLLRFLRRAFRRPAEPPAAPGLDRLLLRPMGYRDLDAVFAIESLSFQGPWRLNSFARAVDDPRQHFLVAELGRQLVGYGGFWVEADRAHIAKVAVRPDFRRQGIGSVILQRLLEDIRSLRLRHAFLEVRRSNLVAQELYCRFGFRFDRVQPHAYPDNGEDALIFVLDPLQAPASETEHDGTQPRPD